MSMKGEMLVFAEGKALLEFNDTARYCSYARYLVAGLS